MKKLDLDAQIREALEEDDPGFLSRLEQPSLVSLVGETFQGRTRWLTGMSVLFTVAFMAVAVVALLELLRAETTRGLVLWQTLLLFCLLAVAANKLWFWMEFQRVTLTREIKRLELQLAQLRGVGRNLEAADRS